MSETMLRVGVSVISCNHRLHLNKHHQIDSDYVQTLTLPPSLVVVFHFVYTAVTTAVRLWFLVRKRPHETNVGYETRTNNHTIHTQWRLGLVMDEYYTSHVHVVFSQLLMQTDI
ncbi:hypothetical protein BpHYR1_008852 [Brachionus plicatilis]|uniref:Uncharacterized protein n=1 Tax=Brachionus plicatilis TaxID=10195 RepID=A0A3M7STE1_BRAPC|nr:hypothetical protein BpHYR1_008852 [Brachionus plicatilis]